jgi:fission process protein 1
MSTNPNIQDETLQEKVVKGEVDSLDSKARYLAYAGRLRTALVASSRYLAYTSDVGEAFRPIVPPAVVAAAYGISWAYLGLDVGYEGYKAVHAGQVKKNKERKGILMINLN